MASIGGRGKADLSLTMSTSTRSQAPNIAGFQSRFAQVGVANLHYWIGGDPNGLPIPLWHGFLGTAYVWKDVMTVLADAGYAVLAPDMRGYGDSDKPEGTDGYDGRSLAEEFRALVQQIGFGKGQPLTIAAHDMGAPPALLWAADHPSELRALLYMELPVMVEQVLGPLFAYKPGRAQEGYMWWWVLPLAPGVLERLIVERASVCDLVLRRRGRKDGGYRCRIGE